MKNFLIVLLLGICTLSLNSCITEAYAQSEYYEGSDVEVIFRLGTPRYYDNTLYYFYNGYYFHPYRYGNSWRFYRYTTIPRHIHHPRHHHHYDGQHGLNHGHSHHMSKGGFGHTGNISRPPMNRGGGMHHNRGGHFGGGR